MDEETAPDGRKPGPGWTRRFFIFGVTVAAAVLLVASLIPDPVVGDPRPIVAVLPAVYATVMIAGVAWFAWWALRRR
jgi:hypothetical protein